VRALHQILRPVPFVTIPELPPENITSDGITCIIYPGTGTFKLGSASGSRGVQMMWLDPSAYFVEFHVKRQNLPTEMRLLQDLPDLVGRLIVESFTNLQGKLRNTVTQFKELRYELRPLGWGEADTVGYRFTLEVNLEQEVI
jgi:hypothetical protein